MRLISTLTELKMTKLTSTQHEAISELARSIRAPLFADRDTLHEAFSYAQEVAKATDNPAAVLTAIYVIMNTLSNQLTTITKGE
jgi:hypothetical protein